MKHFALEKESNAYRYEIERFFSALIADTQTMFAQKLKQLCSGFDQAHPIGTKDAEHILLVLEMFLEAQGSVLDNRMSAITADAVANSERYRELREVSRLTQQAKRDYKALDYAWAEYQKQCKLVQAIEKKTFPDVNFDEKSDSLAVLDTEHDPWAALAVDDDDNNDLED